MGFPSFKYMLALVYLVTAIVYERLGEMVKCCLNLAPDNKTGIQNKTPRVVIAKKT